MNTEFNRRARELFGEETYGLLSEGNLFAGRYMDDSSIMPSAEEILGKPPAEQERIVREGRERRYLYGIFCKKFVSHPNNRDPRPYDTYTYGYLPTP